MFEFKPEWRNLWQHMGGNMPLEDMMVLPRLLGTKNPLLENLFLSRFVKHTVTNLSYLDKVIRELDDQKKTIANVQYLTK